MEAQLAGYGLVSHLAGPAASLAAVLRPGSNLGPFRGSHLAPEALDAWEGAGYSRALAGEALAVVAQCLAHPNLGWGLQLPGADFYRWGG